MSGPFVSFDKGREELRILGRQRLRVGTSIGANYREASRARSDGEFVAKNELFGQEADWKQYWLEPLRDDCGVTSDSLVEIWNEAHELIRIFLTMAENTKRKTYSES